MENVEVMCSTKASPENEPKTNVVQNNFSCAVATRSSFICLANVSLSASVLVGIYLFHIQALLLRDPGLIKRIVNYFGDPLSSLNFFFLKNLYWKEIRLKLTPFFLSGKLKHLLALVEEVGLNLNEYLLKMPLNSNSSLITWRIIQQKCYCNCSFHYSSEFYSNGNFRRNGCEIFRFSTRWALNLVCDDLNESRGGISQQIIESLEYMQMITDETLRLYPPLPFLDRECSLPKGQSYYLEPFFRFQYPQAPFIHRIRKFQYFFKDHFGLCILPYSISLDLTNFKRNAFRVSDSKESTISIENRLSSRVMNNRKLQSPIKSFIMLSLDYTQKHDHCEIYNSMQTEFVAKLLKGLYDYIPNKSNSYGIITAYVEHRQILNTALTISEYEIERVSAPTPCEVNTN
uniref:Cytochrome P450 n=1 Tax=Glossina palpalis gambiensis TaxID=67801 RepID=A0A1B0C4H9_9MUSC